MDNSTFKYSVENLHAATQYECSVAARNEVGQGPDSTPILLITPAGEYHYSTSADSEAGSISLVCS